MSPEGIATVDPREQLGPPTDGGAAAPVQPPLPPADVTSAAGELHYNLTRALYDSQKLEHWSRLKWIGGEDGAPAKYKHTRDNPSENDSDALVLGRAVHVAMLEPDLFASSFRVYAGKHDPRAYAYQDALAEAALAGQSLLKQGQWDDALAIGAAARACKGAQPWLKGKSEVSVFFDFVRPDMGGLEGYTRRMKSRPDLLCDSGGIVDLKSTISATPRRFGKDSHTFRYHVQAALYRHGMAKVLGVRPTSLPYFLLAVEKGAPYIAQMYRIPEPVMALGWRELVELLDRLEHCETTDTWPTYFDDVDDLELPSYAYAADEIEAIEVVS